jgi:hypothetical protein
MIQPLRTIHRRTFVGLAIVLPVILAVGLGARRPSAAGNGKSGATFASLPKTSSGLWAKHTIQTQVYAEKSDLYIILRPGQDLNEPDLLLYLSASGTQGSSLPADAQLLGPALAGRPIRMPVGSGARGQLILNSLAHHEVVDTAALEKLP